VVSGGTGTIDWQINCEILIFLADFAEIIPVIVRTNEMSGTVRTPNHVTRGLHCTLESQERLGA